MAFLDTLKKLLQGAQQSAQQSIVNWAAQPQNYNTAQKILSLPQTTVQRGTFSVQAPDVPKMVTQLPVLRNLIQADQNLQKNQTYKIATAVPRFLGQGTLDMGKQAFEAGANVPLTFANQSSSALQKLKELSLGTAIPMATLLSSSYLAGKVLPNPLINKVIPTAEGPVVTAMSSPLRQLIKAAGQGAIENLSFNAGSQFGKGTMEQKSMSDILKGIQNTSLQAAATGGVLSPLMKGVELNSLGNKMFNPRELVRAENSIPIPPTGQNSTPLRVTMDDLVNESKKYNNWWEFKTAMDNNKESPLYPLFRNVEGLTPGAELSQRTIPVPETVSPQMTDILKTPPPVQEPPTVLNPIMGLGDGRTPPSAPSEQGGGHNMPIIDSIISKGNKLYTELVNRFHPLESAAKNGGQEEAMTKALAAHYGAGSTANYHIEFGLKPIAQDLTKNGLTETDLRSGMIAMRDIEEAKLGNKGSNTGDPMVKLEEMKAALGPEKMAKLGEAMTKTQDWYNSVIKKYLVDTGVVSKESWDEMTSKRQFYVPFKRVMDTMDEHLGVSPNKGAGSVSSQNVIYGYKGSDRAIQDPFESMIENVYKAVSIGKRNEVAKVIGGLETVMPNVIHEVKGYTGSRPNISFMENGKKRTFLVPPDIATAAKGLDEEAMQLWEKLVAIPTKAVRLTATGINPEFMVPNVVRDLQSAFFNIGLNPLEFGKGLVHMIKKDEVYQNYMKFGGRTSSLALDRPFLQQTAENVFGKGGIDVKSPKGIMDIIMNMGEFSEQPTRIASFEKGMKDMLAQGKSTEEAGQLAANMSQEATVNFARRGSKTKAINSLIAFVNARIQGADKTIRTIIDDPKGSFIRMNLITTVPAVLLYQYNRGFKSFNDPRVVSQQDKDSNFIFMLSDSPIEKLRGAQYIKVPKGDIGRFANPTEKFLAYVDQEAPDAGQAIAKLFSPESIVSMSPFNNWGDILPAAVKPLVENAANYNYFRGSTIVPENKMGANFPEGYKSSDYTPDFYKALGQRFKTSPAKLENIGAGYFTGMEKLAMPLLDKLAPAIAGGPVQQSVALQRGQDINRMPVVRRFLGGEKKTTDEQVAQDDKKASSIDFQISDIKSAIKKGSVPSGVGLDAINNLLQQKFQGKEIPSMMNYDNPTTIEELLLKKQKEKDLSTLISSYMNRPSVSPTQTMQDLLNMGVSQTDIKNYQLTQLKSADLADKAAIVQNMISQGKATMTDLYKAGVLTSQTAQQLERTGVIPNADQLIQNLKMTDVYQQQKAERKIQASAIKKIVSKNKSTIKSILSKKAKVYKAPKVKIPKMKKLVIPKVTYKLKRTTLK